MKTPALNRNILALGANSFFTDFSTEMILPLLPIFLERFLHATKSEIGLIEGSAELAVAVLIALSGFYSDRLGKRKGLTVFGYGLSNLIKPLAFFAQSAAMVAMIRIGDRLAKGIRVAPRDALISASTPRESSGFVFGFHKMLDGAGALAGSLTAFAVLYFWGESEEAFRTVFALSLIPGLVSMAILIFLVTDKPFTPAPMRRFRPEALPAPFYWLVGFQSLFSLCAMNYSFMLLKAEENTLSLSMIPLAYALYNLTQAFFAIPIGRLADRYGKPVLLSAVYAAFCAGGIDHFLGNIVGSVGRIRYLRLFRRRLQRPGQSDHLRHRAAGAQSDGVRGLLHVGGAYDVRVAGRWGDGVGPLWQHLFVPFCLCRRSRTLGICVYRPQTIWSTPLGNKDNLTDYLFR